MPAKIPEVQYESFSFAVLRVEAFAPSGARLPGHATGFIMCWKGDRYFVTNNHVVTQRNFLTDQPIHSDFCGFPRKLHAEAALRTSQAPADPISMALLQALPKAVGSMPDIELPVSDEQGNLDAGWVLSKTADVAVYRLDEAHGAEKIGPVTFGFGCLEGPQLNERVTARAMADCFIIGFPELGDQYRRMKSPVYKYASLAVEPELCGSLPLLVDGKTKPGMSGSPVIFKCAGCGKWHLLGVYAGRESADPELTKAELGMVWSFKEHILPVVERFRPRVAAATRNNSN